MLEWGGGSSPERHRRSAARRAAGRRTGILPEDPLVRWVVWFVVAVSIGAPLLAALVMALVQ
jgi:hypothetical protein